jgi:hypothetical protein
VREDRISASRARFTPEIADTGVETTPERVVGSDGW